MNREEILKELDQDLITNGPLSILIDGLAWERCFLKSDEITETDVWFPTFYMSGIEYHRNNVPDRVLSKMRTFIRKRQKELQRKRVDFKTLDRLFEDVCANREGFSSDKDAFKWFSLSAYSIPIFYDEIKEWNDSRKWLNLEEEIIDVKSINWPDPHKFLMWALYDKAMFVLTGDSMQSVIAKETGKTRSYVSAIFQGKRPHKEIEGMIEQKIEAIKARYGAIKWEAK